MWLSDAVPFNGAFGSLARSLSGPGSQASRSQFARPNMGKACRAESSLELKQLTQPCESPFETSCRNQVKAGGGSPVAQFRQFAHAANC
jgi:hypothetical protein